ncbi:transposable element Tcb1 transposase [Trichonephila clavipes]|uniref:Transposable element Tcb1 transposase n=1 Tax=Trichonephila clavipes TaxID=2585209 RepID=A0A8X6RS32_TRICX|nr:transposable element Tcb1 transposase [Trichonephila clavipes]
MSFTRRPGSARLRQTSSREDRHIRPRSKCLSPAFALQRHATSTAGVMGYVHDILQPHVLTLMQRLPGAICQQDTSRPHMARVSRDCLGIVTTLPWLARSPDSSPIEHIWDHF